MTTLSFLLPFTHWHASPLPPNSTITAALFSHHTLILGLSSGTLLLLLSVPHGPHSTHTQPQKTTLHSFLTAHPTPILTIRALPNSSVFITLSTSGHLSKHSLPDGRCLLSIPPPTTSLPKGLKLVERHNASETMILVYSHSTEIAVLSSETLQTVLLWTGSIDWPLPAVSSAGRAILSVMPGGHVQGWVLRKVGGEVAVERDHQRLFSIEERPEWGIITGFERAAERDYVLVQSGGIRLYAADSAHSFVLRKSVPMVGGGEVAGFEVFAEQGVVALWTETGDAVVVARGEEGLWGVVGGFGMPETIGGRSVVLTFRCVDGRVGRWSVAMCGRKEGSVALEVGTFCFKEDGEISKVIWEDNTKVLTTPPSPPPAIIADACTSSTPFANITVFAHGYSLYLHTLPTFLLSYDSPTKIIPIPTSSRICLLTRVKIGEYVTAGRTTNATSLAGGKEYLVLGTVSGELFTVESPNFTVSRRLPLSATGIVSANLLPTTLGKRLRSTLFVSSADGTASIVDVERARIMATFPSHDYLHLTSFATKTSQNIILLTYEDGAHREWDLGEEEGGVLKPPPSSRGSAASINISPYASDLATEGWHEVPISLEAPPIDGEEENEGHMATETAFRACLRFCEMGLPTLVLDVKVVLDTLEAAVAVAQQRSRRAERVVVANNPAVIAAKALLTALVPGGAEELLGWGKQEEYEWRSSVEAYWFRRKTPAEMGQIGAGKAVTLLAPGVRSEGGGTGGTVDAIVLLAAGALVGGLLEAGGREEYWKVAVERACTKLRETGGAPSLGVFAKYWMDRNLLVRRTARMCIQNCMQHLSDEQRDNEVTYWARFLPVVVPPELFTSKDVVRSVVILGKLTANYPDKIDASVKKNVALSVELLLGDANPHFQDTAVELVGYGWSVFQVLFDPVEVIHTLILISATSTPLPPSRQSTLHTSLLTIAHANSPLLGTALSNNIAHGTSTPPLPPSTTLSTAASTITAAMTLTATIIRTSPALLSQTLPHLIASTVKTLDPSSPLREKVLPTVSELVDTLVAAYDTVAFHRPTQRLAVSVSAGSVLVFDLKAAAEAAVLQGHGGVAAPLAFSSDGRYVAAVDGDGEGGAAELLVWRFGGGLLSFIGGGEGPAGMVAPRRRERLRRGGGGGAVLKWTGERCVEVGLGGEVTVVANVEAGKEGWGIL